MQHKSETCGWELPLSPPSSSQDLAENHEFNTATSPGDAGQSLEEVANEFYNQVYGGDGLSGQDRNRQPKDTVMDGEDSDETLPPPSPATLKQIDEFWDWWSYQQKLKEDAELYEDVEEDSSIVEQELPEAQNTQAGPSRVLNPYSDGYVDDRIMSSMAQKRKNDEMDRESAAKKHQGLPPFMLSPPPISPQVSFAQANAGETQEPAVAMPLLGQAHYASPSQSGVPIPPYDADPSLNHSAYAPPLSYYNTYGPPATPYFLQPTSPYTDDGPAFLSTEYVSPLPNDYATVPTYPGHTPSSFTDPAALQHNPSSVLPPTLAAKKGKSSAQKKERTTGNDSEILPPAEIITRLQCITRGIQKKATDVLYQAALDIKQSIHEWHEERDRLVKTMEQRQANYNDSLPDAPGNEKSSPKERDMRKALLSRIRRFEKKFNAVNAELLKRGVEVPI